MEIYNYLKAETNDVINYIKENNIDPATVDPDWLNDLLYDEDSVTGNGSGSYTFNTLQAEQNLIGNWDLLRECTGDDPDFNLLQERPEAADVIIRCVGLGCAIDQALKILDKKN